MVFFRGNLVIVVLYSPSLYYYNLVESFVIIYPKNIKNSVFLSNCKETLLIRYFSSKSLKHIKY